MDSKQDTNDLESRDKSTLPANKPMFFIDEVDGLFLYGSSCCGQSPMHWGMVVSSVELEASQLGCGNGNPGASALGAKVIDDDVNSQEIFRGIYAFGNIDRGSQGASTLMSNQINSVNVASISPAYEFGGGMGVPNSALISGRVYSTRVVQATIEMTEDGNPIMINLNFLLALDCRKKELTSGSNITKKTVSEIVPSDSFELIPRGRFLLLKLTGNQTIQIERVEYNKVWVINRFPRR